jgi:hypothetical protein
VATPEGCSLLAAVRLPSICQIIRDHSVERETVVSVLCLLQRLPAFLAVLFGVLVSGPVQFRLKVLSDLIV